MSRGYRRKNYNDDYLDIIGLVIIGIISYIIKFVIQNFVLIISIILVLSIIILLIINRKRIINLYEKRYIKKLKSNSELFLNIEKINNKYNLCELKDFIDYYNVYNRSSLDNCNIDDYLMMTIHDKYDKLVEYKEKFDELFHMYSIYLEEYNSLKKYINEEEAKEIKMSLKKYDKYQNQIFKEYLIKRNYQFKVVIYVNYSSKKGKVRKNIYKSYNSKQFLDILNEYRKIQDEKKINEINSRIERAKMSVSMRYDVFKRDNFTCSICGRSKKTGATLEVDHVIPVSKGGKTTMDNLQTLCDRCNRGKSNKI